MLKKSEVSKPERVNLFVPKNEKEREFMLEAVKGMLPKTKLGRQMLKKLRVYNGAEHENQAQKPEMWNF